MAGVPVAGDDPQSPRVFGEVAIWRGVLTQYASLRAWNAYLLCLPSPGLRWLRGDEWIDCPPDAALLVDPTLDVEGRVRGPGLVVLVPRRLGLVWSRDRAAVCIVAARQSFAALVRLVDGLLAPGLRLNPPQAQLAGRAVFEWLTGVLRADSDSRPPTAGRREASLLDRLTGYIDQHLAESLDAPSLCNALVCSRSVLYRATAPVGGVSALVLQRRLAAVFARLNDPAEQRTIARLAQDCGFSNACGFSRMFKRYYGRTPAETRRCAAALQPPAA